MHRAGAGHDGAASGPKPQRAALALGAALALAACGHHAAPIGSTGAAPTGAPAAAAPDRLAPLHAFEEGRRRQTDFAKLPPSDRALGPDPIVVRPLPGKGPPRFVSLVRGRDLLVLLDAELKEVASQVTPPLPSGLAVSEAGEIVVTGEQSPAVARFVVKEDFLRKVATDVLDDGSRGLRDVAVGRAGSAHVIYAVDERRSRLLARVLDGGHRDTRSVPTCKSPFRVARAGDQLVVDCLLDHTLAIFDLDAGGLPAATPRATIRHDGPIWSFDVLPTSGGLLVAAGGVEDHVLDRTQGSFGFIDSYVFLYLVPPGGEPRRLAAINVSEHGVITPKAIQIRALSSGGAADRNRAAAAAGVSVLAAGYGSDRLAEITWHAGLEAPPSIVTRTILPGAASFARAGDLLVFADPLLDAWFSLSLIPAPELPVPVPVPAPVPLPLAVPVPTTPPPEPEDVADSGAPARDPLSRVGEALFFTNLMAPWNKSEGRLSRFTCETCHFEGYVDGRTHHTGRGDVHATTKPLLGLFNNRPHFSRALDPDLTVMVDNEFRAAGSKSDHDPWFSAADTGLSWIPLLGVPVAELDAIGLRRALMTFFMDFSHRPNPAVLERPSFTDLERRGAEVFRGRRCEGCHEARLSADDPATRVPHERWEALVLSREGPIVWGSKGYWKTGVEPYVHEEGARPPSLRRLYAKWPYFTNGSAKSLREVLERARFQGDETWHDRAPDGATGLSAKEIDALLAFLDLL